MSATATGFPSTPGPAAALPHATTAVPTLIEARDAGRLAVFLDYDGTLTPIVASPELAVLDDDAREVVRRLAEASPTALISGRDLVDLVEHVALDGVTYAGSHGLEVQHPDGTRQAVAGAEAYREALDRAASMLEARLAGVPGARVERKRFALAAHYRQVAELQVADVREAVMEAAAQTSGLHVTGGKMVLELRPELDWHKGRAVRQLLAPLPEAALPLYIGDDQTDEDAFQEIARDGLGVVVGEPPLTWARLRVADVPEAVRFLDQVAQS